MKTSSALTLILTAALASCASSPRMAPIDNALLAEVPTEAKAPIADARPARDAAEDAYALARSNTKKAEAEVELARAALKTIRSQLDQSKTAVEAAAQSTENELSKAQAQHTHALANADYAREYLAVRKRELELAKLREKLAQETRELSLAQVELKKAEALQNVDLVEAQSIPIKDYRKQVAYHEEEVDTTKSRVRTAQRRTEDAQTDLIKMKRKVDSLKPAP